MQSVWHDVHISLITYVKDEMVDQLPVDLVARAEESVSLIGAGDELLITRPDVSVSESASWKEGEAPTWNPVVDESVVQRVATPVIVTREEEQHRWIEISDTSGTLVTVIEVLSPVNKTKAGRKIFEDKLEQFWERGVSTVEIDLIRGGISADAVRAGNNWPSEPQQVIVTRRGCSSRHEVYPCPLRSALPVFRIPLREHETDLPFDLQPLINRCYSKGRYWLLDYSKDPSPSLKEADLKWARSLIA